jgi:N-acetylneuraminic acid mutarotase
MRRRNETAWVLVGLVLSGCSHDRWAPSPVNEPEPPLPGVEVVGARVPPGEHADRAPRVVALDRSGERLVPRFAAQADATPRLAHLHLPERSDGAFRVTDASTGVWIEATLRGARSVPAELSDGRVLYRAAAAEGGDITHRPLLHGTEDVIHFERRPERTAVTYDVVLGHAVRGLRLVEGVLEVLDAAGAPRLRVHRPYLVDADGAHHDAALALSGCAVDTDPSAPWGRPPVAPGARRCELAVHWDKDARIVYPAALDPLWTSAGAMMMERGGLQATLLGTGDVLVSGGYDINFTQLASAELYDRASNSWAVTGSLPSARYLHSATSLPDGRALVAGGYGQSDPQGTSTSVVVYDPVLGSFSTAASFAVGRARHAAALLADGTVLVAGGWNVTLGDLATAERYDPSTNAWIPTTSMQYARAGVPATRLADDRVLVVMGGNTGAEIYNPTTGLWSFFQTFNAPANYAPAALLGNGKVLFAGGAGSTYSIGNVAVFDPSTGMWTPLPSFAEGRSDATLTSLGNGMALLAGGECTGIRYCNSEKTYKDARMFDPTTQSWLGAGNTVTGHQSHAAVALDGESVLVVGGYFNETAELFTELATSSSAGVGSGSGGGATTSAGPSGAGGASGGSTSVTGAGGSGPASGSLGAGGDGATQTTGGDGPGEPGGGGGCGCRAAASSPTALHAAAFALAMAAACSRRRARSSSKQDVT